ncbi:MAG: caspase family protein, partial [Treponema sp.]|nr:caspase family protein [Treponema sp.]
MTQRQNTAPRAALRALLCAALFALPLLQAYSQQKYALVIGNAAYTGITKLNNPVNDANDMSAALRDLGFTVDTLTNATLRQMRERVRQFRQNLAQAKEAYGFFYYAGHGVQSDGNNYLIPVDADIQTESDLPYDTLRMQWVLDTINDSGNALNVVVIDACRDNPFGWNRSGNRGLVVEGVGQSGKTAPNIIVYAASAGQAAIDGTGRNGLFTTHLLNNLKKPGVAVMDMLRDAGRDTAEASGGKQVPAIHDQFFKTAYLGKPAAPVQKSTAAAPEVQVSSQSAAKGPKVQEEVIDTGSVRVTVLAAGTLEVRRGKEVVQSRKVGEETLTFS